MFKIIFSLFVCLLVLGNAVFAVEHPTMQQGFYGICGDGIISASEVCVLLFVAAILVHCVTIRVVNTSSSRIVVSSFVQNLISLLEVFVKFAVIPLGFYLTSNALLKLDHSFVLHEYCQACVLIVSLSLFALLVSYIVLQPNHNNIRCVKLTQENSKKIYRSIRRIICDIVAITCFMKLAEKMNGIDLFIADLACRTIMFLHILVEVYHLTCISRGSSRDTKIAFIGMFGRLTRYVNKKMCFVLCILIIAIYGSNIVSVTPCLSKFVNQVCVALIAAFLTQIVAVGIMLYSTRKSLQINAMNIGRFGANLRRHLFSTANVAISVIYASFLYAIVVFLFCESEEFLADFGGLYVTLKAAAQVYAVFFLYKCVDLYMSYKVEKLYLVKGGRSKTLRSVFPMVAVGIKFVVVVMGSMVVLANYGVNLTPVYTAIVGLGVPISLAAKSTVTSFIKGFMMLLEDEVEIGDCVETSGVKGIVEELGIRTLKIRAFDGTVHIIPYEIINVVSNSSKDYTLHLMEAYCPVDVNINDFVAALNEVKNELPHNDNLQGMLIKGQDFNFIRVKTFDNCGTNISWAYQTKPDVVGAFECEFYAMLRKKLDNRGIAYPKFIGRHLEISYKATV